MNIWDDIWDKDPYSNEDVRNRKAQHKLNKFRELGVDFFKYHSVGDFGSGAGYVSLNLLNQYQNICDIDLYDNSKLALQKAKINLSGFMPTKSINFYECNLNFPIDLPSISSDRYDLIIAFSILEHLESMNQAIDNIYQALHAKGELLLIWSNTNSVFYYQHKLFEIMKMWRYGYTKEMCDTRLIELFQGRFSIIRCSVESCFGDKGVLSILDSVMHKVSSNAGRYIFLHLQKK